MCNDLDISASTYIGMHTFNISVATAARLRWSCPVCVKAPVYLYHGRGGLGVEVCMLHACMCVCVCIYIYIYMYNMRVCKGIHVYVDCITCLCEHIHLSVYRVFCVCMHASMPQRLGASCGMQCITVVSSRRTIRGLTTSAGALQGSFLELPAKLLLYTLLNYRNQQLGRDVSGKIRSILNR